MKNDFDLNDIAKKVGNVAQEAKISIDSHIQKAGLDKVFKQVDETMKSVSNEFKLASTNAKQAYNSSVKSQNIKKVKVIAKKIPSSSVGGILCTVFGAIGTGVWGIFAGGSLVVSNLADIENIAGSVFMGLLLISVTILVIGIKNTKKYTRFKRYAQRIGDSLFCELQFLMDDVGKQKRLVISDLKQMRTYGYLYNLYFDKDKKNVMFDNQTYLHYEESIKNQLLKKEQLQDEVLQKAKDENTHKAQSADEKKVKEIIEKGHQQLLEIKSFNDLIKGSVLYEKVEQFYKITNVIFGAIQKMPNNIDDIRKVHEYYLPSVIKMLDVYVKLNVQVEETENIKESKQHIEGAIDTLNKAFAELLDTLFEDEALDVYSDISVLNMVLAQEGLLGNDDFKTNK